MGLALRTALAVAAIALTFAAALYVHQREVVSAIFHAGGPSGTIGQLLIAGHYRPSWESPAALAIAIGGIVLATAIMRFRQPRANGRRRPN